MILYFFVLLLVPVGAAPSNAPGKLAFSLAEPEADVIKTEKQSLSGILRGISENSYFRDFMSLMKIVSSASDTKPELEPARARAAPSKQSESPVPLDADRSFRTSLSMDEAIQTVPAAKNISKEEWAHTLFGERGVLTGVFRMMDQQRKVKPAQSDHAHDPSAKINGGKPLDVDFQTIFDSLLMGGSSKGQFGDPGPELPEFLGICNRLSCGDIYKAVDKFRRSEFFSNFQTALTLVQDPNGWETIGKLLSNPELISQFTAGSGMEEVFGSALGQAKKESEKSKDKNSKLLPEDGDFGTDFSGWTDAGPPKKLEGEMPDIDFNIDKPLAGDYYEEVSKKDSEPEPDYEDLDFATIDELPPPPSPALAKKPEGPEMPELSFSIDGSPDEVVEGQVFQKPVDNMPPPSTQIKSSMGPAKEELHKAIGSFNGRFVTVTSTRAPATIVRQTTTTASTTVRTTTQTTRRTRPTTTTPKTTTKNYRKESDYYSMYYDD